MLGFTEVNKSFTEIVAESDHVGRWDIREVF